MNTIEQLESKLEDKYYDYLELIGKTNQKISEFLYGYSFNGIITQAKLNELLKNKKKFNEIKDIKEMRKKTIEFAKKSNSTSYKFLKDNDNNWIFSRKVTILPTRNSQDEFEFAKLSGWGEHFSYDLRLIRSINEKYKFIDNNALYIQRPSSQILYVNPKIVEPWFCK